MDEAGQITYPISLGPLMFSSMFILVGDHYQLQIRIRSQFRFRCSALSV
ncbi:DNA replication ATP-dependent helicase/nuclease JHS1 [Linum grandiflorum]